MKKALVLLALVISGCAVDKLTTTTDKLIYGPAITVNAYTNETITWTNTNCITLSGTASVESGTVTAVKVIYNGNTYTAQGTTSWSFTANNMVELATNYFTVYAVSSTGQYSPVNTFKIGVDTLDPAGLNVVLNNLGIALNFGAFIIRTNLLPMPSSLLYPPVLYGYCQNKTTNGIVRIPMTGYMTTQVQSTICTPEPISSIYIAGDRIYACSGSSLFVYGNNQFTTLYKTFTGGSYDKCLVAGSYLYTGGYPYFRIFNNFDFSIVRQLYLAVNDFEIKGNYAYSVGTAFSAIDISVPANASVVSAFSNYSLGNIKISGNYAFCIGMPATNWGLCLVSVDISTPSSPKYITNYSLVSNGILSVSPRHNFHIVSNYAYIISDNKILVLNISNPSNITFSRLITHHTTIVDSDLAESFISENYLIVSSGYGGIGVYSISNASTPQLIKNIFNNVSHGIALNNDNIYTVTDFGALNVFRRNNFTNVAWTNTLNFISSAFDEMFDQHIPYRMAVKGSFIYSIGYKDGLRIFNNSDINRPSLAKTISPGSKTSDFAINNNYLYLVEQNGIDIVDISSPVSASIVNSFFLYNANSVSVKGNYLYTLSYGTTLSIYYLSSPVSPVLLKSYTVDNDFYKSIVRVSDNAAFIGVDTSFKALDVSDPSNVYQFFSESQSSTVLDIEISGRYAFLGLSDGHTVIYDIGNLSNITQVRNINHGSSGNVFNVLRNENVVFAADDQFGLVIMK